MSDFLGPKRMQEIVKAAREDARAAVRESRKDTPPGEAARCPQCGNKQGHNSNCSLCRYTGTPDGLPEPLPPKAGECEHEWVWNPGMQEFTCRCAETRTVADFWKDEPPPVPK